MGDTEEKSRVSPGHGQLRVALWIFLTLSVFYIGLTRGRFLSTDEIHTYQATRSLWEHGTAAIESPEAYRGPDGRRYAIASSGLSIASLPLYGTAKLVESFCRNSGKQDWLKIFAGPVVERPGDRWGGEAGIFFVNLFNCFATAALVALFYCFSLQIGTSTRWALCAAAFLGLTSFVAPFSTGFFQHSSEALFLLAAFYFLFRDRETPDWRWRLCGGVSAALLIQFRFPAVVALPGLIFYNGIILWDPLPEGRRGIVEADKDPAPISAIRCCSCRDFRPSCTRSVCEIRHDPIDCGNYASLRSTNPLLHGLYGFLFSPGESIFLSRHCWFWPRGLAPSLPALSDRGLVHPRADRLLPLLL